MMTARTTIPDEISSAEHLEYLASSVRLMLWFTWRLIDEHPEETFSDIIHNRTDIWRRTSLNPNYLNGSLDGYDSPEWRAVLSNLEGIHSRNRQHGSAQAFEDEAAASLMPYLASRVGRDLKDLRNKVDLARYQCGSLRYNLQPNPDAPQRIGFHIANACYPASLFVDPLYLPRCFVDLMEQCEGRFRVTEIGTGTWMNSYTRWVTIFPQEWMGHMSLPDHNIRGHYGYWGQFLTARRTFNHKLGRQFRETGRIPFPRRTSWCSIEAMRNHLRSLMDTGGVEQVLALRGDAANTTNKQEQTGA